MKAKIFLAIISIVVVFCLIGMGTMAWFTSRAESTENTFVTGTLHLGGKIDGTFEKERFATLQFKNMQPNESRELGPIELKNMGTLPLKIYRISAENAVGNLELAGVIGIKVRFGDTIVFDGKLSDLFFNSKGFFTFEQRLSPEEETSFFVEIKMDETADNSYQGRELSCNLLIHAVQTNKTTVMIMDSLGNPLPGAEFSYWNGQKWISLGTTDSSGSIGSIFPPNLSTTHVQITYKGYTKTVTQDIRNQSFFVFGTSPVTVKLVGSDGQPIPGAVATVSYAPDYPGPVDGSYRILGTTDENGEVKAELLPYDYYFKMYYKGAYTAGISYNIVANPVIIFKTGKVHSLSGKCTSLHPSYGGSWIPFTQDIELLPMSYEFKFSDGNPNQTAEVIAGQVTYIH
ncbi:TasA family protein [Thermovenabulum sp.]|uniref:TasA family protein n=1 Tax=Thermovenabulum sp. TaxID=3100335 RepID=UPI003C7985F9